MPPHAAGLASLHARGGGVLVARQETVKAAAKASDGQPSPIIFWVVLLVAFVLIFTLLVVAGKFGWLKSRAPPPVIVLRNIPEAAAAAAAPPKIEDLDAVAPALRCDAWLKRCAAVTLAETSDAGQASDQVAVIDCAICLKTMDLEESVRELPCLHVYHQMCIDQYYFLNFKTCPLCRKAFVQTKGSVDEAIAAQQQLEAGDAQPADEGRPAEEIAPAGATLPAVEATPQEPVRPPAG